MLVRWKVATFGPNLCGSHPSAALLLLQTDNPPRRVGV